MKKVLNFLLSLVAGFAGAYLFYLLQPTITQSTSGYNTESQAVTLTHYEPERANSHFEASNSQNVLKPKIASDVNFVEASAVSRQSVVYIKTITQGRYRSNSMFDLFFNRGYTQRKIAGSGSGVIFSKDGYIVTNNHVIDGADEIEVVHNKKTYKAKIVGIDPSTDLAVLKVETDNMPAIPIGKSSTLSVGDWVLAVGNPFNLESTVTAGIVSAKGRRINILEDIFPIESFIQTDAAINPGNSGGALVNIKGELVGINTAILSKTGSYAGYGFAVPVDIVVKIMEDLKNYGEVQKAFTGVEVIDVDEDISGKLGLDDLYGVVVAFIEKGGAGEKIGLEKGDVIVEINGVKIDSKADFDEQISYHSPGDIISVGYKRNNKSLSADLTLTNIQGTTGIVKRNIYEASRTLGAVLEEVPKLELSRLGIESGVRIIELKSRGLIYEMDLEAGFIISEINNYRINDPQELEEILGSIRGRVIIEGLNSEGRERTYMYNFNFR